MKWILAILLFISLGALAQTPRPDDSTKYIWYQNQYGLRQSRIASDSFFHVPYGDTTGRRPYRNGAIMMYNGDGKLYKWNNGFGWNLSSGTGPSRFGIEDNTGVQDRSVNMQGHPLTIDSASDINLIGTNGVTSGQLALSNIARLFAYDNVKVHSISLYPDYIAINGPASNDPPRVWIQASDSLKTRTPNSFVVMHNDTLKVVPVDSVAGVIGAQTLDRVLRTGNVDTATSIQFGYQDTGYVQGVDGTDRVGIPMVLYPYTARDTSTVTPRRVDFFKTITNNYDGSQPLNTITEIFKYGSNNLSDHYFRIAAEQNFYNSGEFHGFEYKLNDIGAAIRGMSATWDWDVPDLSTTTFRAGQFAFQPTLSDTQLLVMTPGAATLTQWRNPTPQFKIQQYASDGTKGGMMLQTNDGSTLVNWHLNTATPTFHNLIFDLPGQWTIGCARSVAVEDPEFNFLFSNLSNNRFVQWKRGTKVMGVLKSDVSGNDHWVFGGDYSTRLDNAVTVKTYRNYALKPFGVAITNSSDSILKAPISTDTLGNVIINLPDPNTAWQDGLLFESRTEKFRVYGETYLSDTVTIGVMDSTASPTNMVWRDPNTKQLKLAAAPMSGTYTPTLTGVNNIASSTAYVCRYTRIGNIVTVTGRFYIDFTTTGDTHLGISLPIASAFSDVNDCTGVTSTGFNPGGIIAADAANDRADFYIQTGSSADYTYHFSFTYTVQ